MKKLAYTLTEVLVTMGIIGIVAAIAAPAIFNAKPDTKKLMYLRLYDNLSKITKDIASNSKLYLPLSSNVATKLDEVGRVTRDVSNVPLTDLSQPLDEAYADCNNRNTKFACILATALGGTNITTSDTTYSFDYENKRWQVIHQTGGLGTDDYFQYVVNVDTIPGNGTAGLPDQRTYADYPRNFDTYIFWISPSGSVFPADLPGQMYVDTRLSTNQRGNLSNLIDEWVRNGKYYERPMEKYREYLRLKDREDNSDFPIVQ